MRNISELYFPTRDWEMEIYKKLHIRNLQKLYLNSPQFRMDRLRTKRETTGDSLLAPTLEQLQIFDKISRKNEIFHLTSGAVVSTIAVGFLFLAQADLNHSLLPYLASGVTALYALCIDFPALIFQRYTRGRIQKILKE